MPSKLNVCNNSTSLSVTNAAFIAAIFKPVPEGATPVVCTKPGNPTEGGWPAIPATECELPTAHNNYINCSTFRLASNGSIAAKHDYFTAYHFILLDDVGTKVKQEQLQGLIPTWILETSPGNFQWGFVLAEPIRDYGQAQRLQKAVARKGLTDPGASGPNRWARLPVGINGKPEYGKDGKPFECRLHSFNPELRFTVEQLVELLDLDLNETTTPPTAPGTSMAPATLAELEELLDDLDPSMGRDDWFHVGVALWHETGGSEEGFELFNRWSSKGTNYKGTKDVWYQWDSFHEVPNPVTKASLWWMVMNHPELWTQRFEPCEFTVEGTPQAPSAAPNPLARYSITGKLDELRRMAKEEKPLLGSLALHGQFTVLFAAPNSGKTLITFRLILDAIADGRVDAPSVYYLDMDDTMTGLIEKAEIAEEAGFHLLGDGHLDFRREKFIELLEQIIADRLASDTVIILDTLKKFISVMNKEEGSSFGRLIGRFSGHGGTIIALAVKAQ